MRVHLLLHADHEDSGCIEPWLLRRGHEVNYTRLHAGEMLPQPEAFDWLIVMGGPMSIYEHAAYPWLAPEKVLIRKAIDAQRRVLGICLGAQLIADVLGGKVSRNAHNEIGWFEVRRNPSIESRFFNEFPTSFTAFHWHGDTFAAPPGAKMLMSSEACAHQAFEHGGRVAGIQFHLEVTAANARDWLAHEPPPPARYVQAPETILSGLEGFAENNRLMFRLLEAMEAG